MMNEMQILIQIGLKPVPETWYSEVKGSARRTCSDRPRNQLAGQKRPSKSKYVRVDDPARISDTFRSAMRHLIRLNQMHGAEIYAYLEKNKLLPNGMCKSEILGHIKEESRRMKIQIPLMRWIVADMYKAGASEDDITRRVGKPKKQWHSYLVEDGIVPKKYDRKKK